MDTKRKQSMDANTNGTGMEEPPQIDRFATGAHVLKAYDGIDQARALLDAAIQADGETQTKYLVRVALDALARARAGVEATDKAIGEAGAMRGLLNACGFGG